MPTAFTGGKLKLKGGVELKKKKKKKRGKAEASLPTEEETRVDSPQNHVDVDKKREVLKDTRTDAEKRREAHMSKYEKQRAEKAASKSHRERIKELNDKLATLTEHHDIPRVSYSYM